MEGLNIEAYDADSLRKMVRLLEYENKILKDKLKKAGISYEEVNPFEEKKDKMRYIYQSIHNHAGRWLQSGCSERKTQEICGISENVR